MKAFNIEVLLEARLDFFNYNNLTLANKEAIVDFLMDIEIDLNEFNMDDFVVNGLSYISKEEVEEYREDCTVIFEDEDEAIVMW